MSMLRLILLAALFGAVAGLADHAFGQPGSPRPAGPPPAQAPDTRQPPPGPSGPARGETPRRPPPPEALAACKSLAAGAACSFNTPERGPKKGSCWAPEGRPLACRPSDAPPPPPPPPPPQQAPKR